MTTLVSTPEVKRTSTASIQIGAQPPKSVRVPSTEAEYLDLLSQCNGDCYEEDCAFCIKFALEKAEEFSDRAAIEFLKLIPVEVQQFVDNAISRIEIKLLPAAMES